MTKEFNFTAPKRFDKDLAENGIWLDVYDENDNPWGSYLLAMFNMTSPYIKNKVSVWNRKNEQNIKSKKLKDSDGIFRAFVDIALLDWSGTEVLNGGKPLPFSADTAFALLTHEDFAFLAETLLSYAGDVRNYKGVDPEADQEADAKN